MLLRKGNAKSDAKTLFAINADGGFVVSLVLFKMIEALKIKEIDEMIESSEPAIEKPLTDVEPISMIEEAEIGIGNCVSQCDESSVKEFDGSDILKEPMIEKAATLFEATKITVQSKV